MYKYLLQKWKSKKDYILGLIGLLLFFAIKPSAHDSAGMGIFLGCIIACLIYLGPAVFVDVRRIRIRQPFPKYVEQTPFRISLWYVPSMLLVAGIILLVLGLVPPFGEYVERQADADTFMGGLLMMFFIVSAFLAPVSAYMIFIKTRYKKIVEYGSAEWKRLRR